MLPVGVNGDDMGHAEPSCFSRGGEYCRAFSPVFFVADKPDRKVLDDFRASVSAAIINDKNITADIERPGNNLPQCPGMVVNGNNDERFYLLCFKSIHRFFLKEKGVSCAMRRNALLLRTRRNLVRRW